MKKLLTLLLASVSLIVLFSFPASAKNNKDSVFRFYFTQDEKFDYDYRGRVKEDDSGTYLRYMDGTATSAKFRVYGGDKDKWYACNNRYNETKNDFAYVRKGQTGCISQYVYENRYSHYNTSTPYAFLYAYVDIVNGGVISSAEGLWSPDTLGSYPYFNR